MRIPICCLSEYYQDTENQDCTVQMKKYIQPFIHIYCKLLLRFTSCYKFLTCLSRGQSMNNAYYANLMAHFD